MRIKTWLVVVLVIYSLCETVAVAQQRLAPFPEYVTAPGGRISYHIETDRANPANSRIVARLRDSSDTKVLLQSKPDADPKHDLVGFSNLKLSPDGKSLYFHTAAWATSPAIHVLNLDSGNETFVVDGHIKCIVAGGEYQGNLLVEQHRYFVGGGSYDVINLIRPDGSLVGPVTFDVTNRRPDQMMRRCLSLGQ